MITLMGFTIEEVIKVFALWQWKISIPGDKSVVITVEGLAMSSVCLNLSVWLSFIRKKADQS
jgi:hypothetical protein